MVPALAFAKKYGSSAMKNSFFFASTLSYTGMLSTATVPPSGLSTPDSMRSTVLFPAPFVPIRPKTVFSRMATLTSSTAFILSKYFVRLCISIISSSPSIPAAARFRIQAPSWSCRSPAPPWQAVVFHPGTPFFFFPQDSRRRTQSFPFPLRNK